MPSIELSKTIYSICYPHTKKTLKSYLEDPNIPEYFTQTWSKKQDSVHLDFAKSWLKWVEPALKFDLKQLEYFYPTAGSSEAIREQIVYLHSQNKRLVVFEGEYEGYEAIANAVLMPILKIKRDVNFEKIKEAITQLNPHTDIFIISQPSSIDGNVWVDFSAFMAECSTLKIDVYLDTAYVGACNKNTLMDVSQYTCLAGIFFSLSKSFGVYYHRIGGVFLNKPNPLLYGNMWFKNILAIKYGQLLLDRYELGFFSNELVTLQKNAIEKANVQYGVKFEPSNVFLIANTAYLPEEYSWQKALQRNDNLPHLRVCLSQYIETELNANGIY